MSYFPKPLSSEVAFAFAALVKEVHDYLANQTLTNVSVEFKLDGSPVTNLDIEIENFVRMKASVLLPNFQVIGEESSLPEEWTGNYLVVDPIDGTENFVSGIPIWGTGLALFFNNQLSASCVTFPELGLFYPSKELLLIIGEFGRRFRSPSAKSRVLGYSSNSNWSLAVKNFPQEVRVFGCSLFNLTLATTSAITFQSSSKGARLWDIIAPVLLALESERKVTINGEEYFGEFLDPNFRYVVEIKNF